MRWARVGLARRGRGRELGCVLGRDDGAPAERRQARIVDDDADLVRRTRRAVPAGEDGEAIRAVLDRDLGAQLVEAEALGEVCRIGTGDVEIDSRHRPPRGPRGR